MIFSLGNHKRQVSLLSVLVLLLSALLWTQLVVPVTGFSETTIFMNPTMNIAAVDGNCSIDIWVYNVTDLYYWEFRLNWSSSVLEFINASWNPPFGWFGFPPYIYYIANNEEGYADITGEVYNGPASGTVYLCSVKFAGEVVGLTDLNFSYVELFDSFIEIIPSGAFNGSVEVFEVSPSPYDPMVNFTYTPSLPSVNDTVVFNALSTVPRWDGTEQVRILDYWWGFGDGNSKSTSAPVVTHKYAENGTFTVSLRILDLVGLSNKTFKTITVLDSHGPTANFTIVGNAIVNRTTTFDASLSLSGSNGTHQEPIVNYTWDFGDGSNTTEADPVAKHEYTAEGEYNVTLTVLDSQGLNDSLTKTITVYETVHDVAVLSVTPECSFAYTTWGTAGGSPNLKIEVVVENQGSEAENFNVTVWYINETRGTIATKPVSLGAGENTTVTFSWTIKNNPYGTGSITVGKYTICANASVVSGETDVADNTLIGPIFTLKFGGDANGDGFIGGYDATILSGDWWRNVPKCHKGDFNSDQFIGGFDITVVSINWWQNVPKP